MPVTIWAAIRAGSEPGPGNASIDRTVNVAEPTETSRCVRIPAGWPWYSRSSPTGAPRMADDDQPERPTRAAD